MSPDRADAVLLFLTAPLALLLFALVALAVLLDRGRLVWRRDTTDEEDQP